jgi:hypothetical protein
MSQYVDIEFECLPLRSVGRLDIPIDASPAFRARCERIKAALENHGSHNTYYLFNAHCTFHFTNHADLGMVEYKFEGTVMTDSTDQKTERADLQVELVRENCDWLTEPASHWLADTVSKAVLVEFDRYIAAGDLAQTLARIAKLQAQSDEHGGFVGMYL